jgi:hypothetical protein
LNLLASQQTTTSVVLLEKEVADRKQAVKEREKLIKELQEAFENIKTLRTANFIT